MTAQQEVVWTKLPKPRSIFNRGTPPKNRRPIEVRRAFRKLGLTGNGLLLNHRK